MGSLKKSFAVVGLSKFGYRVATSIFGGGVDVIAIDRDDHLIQKIADQVTRAVRADAVDEEILEHLGVFDVDVVVLGFRSSFDAAVLLTMMLRKKREDIHIIVQVDTDEKAEALHRVGANVTVFPERDIADRLVKRLRTPNLVEHIPLTPDVAIIEVEVPRSFVGKSLSELDIRARHQVHVIGIVQGVNQVEDKKITIAPTADTLFEENDVVLVLGTTGSLEKFTDWSLGS